MTSHTIHFYSINPSRFNRSWLSALTIDASRVLTCADSFTTNRTAFAASIDILSSCAAYVAENCEAEFMKHYGSHIDADYEIQTLHEDHERFAGAWVEAYSLIVEIADLHSGVEHLPSTILPLRVALFERLKLHLAVFKSQFDPMTVDLFHQIYRALRLGLPETAIKAVRTLGDNLLSVRYDDDHQPFVAETDPLASDEESLEDGSEF